MIEDVSRWVCGWQFLLYYAVLRCTHAYAKDSLFAVRFERRWYRKMKKKKRVYTKRTVIRGSRRERERSWGGGQVNLEKVRERKGEKRRCWTRPSSIIRRKQSEQKKKKKKGRRRRATGGACSQPCISVVAVRITANNLRCWRGWVGKPRLVYGCAAKWRSYHNKTYICHASRNTWV